MSLRSGKSLYLQAARAYLAASATPPPMPRFWIEEFANVDLKDLIPIAIPQRRQGLSSFVHLLMTSPRINDWGRPFAPLPWKMASTFRDLIPEPAISQRARLLATTTHTPLPDERPLAKYLRYRSLWRP